MPPPVEEANGSNPKRKEKKRKKKKRDEREAAQAGAPEVAGVEPGAAAEAPETPGADTGGNGATSVVDGKTVGASIDPTQHVASLSTTAENGEASDLKGKMKRRRKKRNGDHASSADNVLPGHVSVVQQAAPGSHVPADTQDTNPTVEEEPGGGSSQEGTIPGSVPTPRDQDNVKNLEKKRRRKEKRASGASVRPEDALLLAQKTSDMPVTQSGVSEVRPEVGEGQGESQPPRDGAQPGYREKLSWQDTLRQGEVTERRQELTKHRRQHRKQLPVEKGDTPLRRSTEEPRVDLKGQGRLRQEEVEGQPSQQPPVKPKESRGEEVREQQQLQHFGKQDRLPQKASNERTVVGQERQGLLEESPVLREQEQLRKQNQKEAAGPGKRKQDAVIQASKSKKKPSEQSELRSGSRDERKKRKSKPSGQKDGQRRNGSHRLPSSSPETSIESDVPGAAGVGGRSSRQDPPADVVVPLAESSVKSSEGVSAATPATGSDDSRTHREGEEGPKPTKRSRPRTFTKRGRWRHLDNVVPLPLSGEERASSSEWRRRLAELFKHLDSPQTIAPSEWIPVDSWTDFRGLMGALTGAVEDLKQAQAEGPRGFLSREDWLSSQREASSLPLGDDSCFERNVRYSPGSEFLIVWRGVPTATHCQALCKIASPECSFFTFMRNTLFPLWLQGSCFLLRSKTPVQPSKTRSSLVVSGPRSCSPVTPDAPPPDFITTATQTGCAGSPSICDALILPFPLGARFTQSCGPTRGGICANSALGVSCCTECDSSPENPCPDKYCYEFNVDYVDGEELRYVGAGVENRGACESLCRETEGCTHYSYFSSHLLPHHLRGSCSLRHFQETPKERVQISLARFDTPDGGDGAFSLTDRHYRENRSFALFAPLDCPLSSTAQTLSRTSAVRNRKKKSRGDKGKSDNAENLCLEKDTDFWGGDLVSFRGCESVEACRAYCTHTDGCTAFTYVPIKRRCYLKWDAAQKLSVVGHISGPRCCQSSPSPPGTSTAGGPPAMRMSDGHATVTSSACPPPRSNPCLYTGHDYTGYDLEMVPNVISAYKCYELCHNDSLCEVWTHVSYEQLCFLKASGAPHGTLARKFVRDRLVASPAAVTGFSNCDPIYDGRDST
ncbi:pan domain-containing protein [Cystoisospora suis]|uniref:Pan domain-containing protein n=1 Tax=Cystoisospora suis TaxID=483139 RepID=A0A2C6LH90_9APIC|nr:pan domain-containing protein [Cystoisospora suis]